MTYVSPMIIALCVLAAAALYVLVSLSLMKIFAKAGKSKGAGFVPFYRFYVLYKLIGKSSAFFASAVLTAAGSVFALIDSPYTRALCAVCFIGTLAITAVASVKLSEAFSRPCAFAVGLFFLPCVFLPILGFSKAEYVGESVYKKQTDTKKLVLTAMLSAFAAVLMLWEFALPIAPSFYKLDLSEVPVMIGTFSMGPLAGVVIEAVKIVLKLVIKGTTTVGIGDFANFAIGCVFVIPAGLIYKSKKTKKNAIIGMALSTILMTVAGVFLNAFVLIPAYSAFMPIEQIVQMGKDIFPAVTDTFTLCLFCVAPFNLIKGVIISVIVALIYKPLSRLIHQKM